MRIPSHRAPRVAALALALSCASALAAQGLSYDFSEHQHPPRPEDRPGHDDHGT